MVNKKITKLTPEQEARIPHVREKWLRVGLSTEPADRVEAEEGVRFAYKAANLEPPKYVVWLDSPYQGAIAAAFLSIGGKEGLWTQVGYQIRDQIRDQVWDQIRAQIGVQVWDQVWDQVRTQVWNQVRDQVWTQVGTQVWTQVRDQVGDQVRDQIRDQIRAQVWIQVRDQVGDQVWTQVGDQVEAQVWDQVWDQVGDQVWTQVRDQVWNQVYRAVYGQHEAAWLSFYDFFDFLPVTEQLRGIKQVAKHAGWWWPFENICILTERPIAVLRDGNNRLHSLDRKAIEYRDGWGIYAVHGTRVPPEWIEDKNALTPEIALTWPNIEQRRAACELLGWERILSELNARVIDTDPDPQVGQLVEVDIPEIGRERFLRVLCGTGRSFALPVPPNMQTALEANSWTYGVDTSVIRNLEIRT